MPRGSTHRYRSFWERRHWIVILLLTILALIVSGAGIRLYEEVSLLRSAPRDNVQWTTSQLEVETIQLHLAIEYARAGEASLDDVRRRFDFLYSRIRLVSRGRLFRGFRETLAASESIEPLERFLDEVTPLMDSSDTALFAALEQIDGKLEDLTAKSRMISVLSNQYFAGVSDNERNRFVQVLTLAVTGGILLIGLLAVLLVYIYRQHRHAANRSKEIESSRRLLTAINEAALDAIIVADDCGNVIGWNQAAVRIFGFSPNQAIGRSLASLIIPEQYRSAHEEGMKRYLATGEKKVVDAGRVELTALRADGSEFPVELAIAGSGSDQSPIFFAYLRDISTRRAAEHELLEARDVAMAADRAKSEFLAVMSHEMRTPLNGVLGVLELLRATPLNTRQRRYIENAVFSGEVLLRHINEVLDLSRIEAGKMIYEHAPVNIAEIISQVLEVGRTGAEANGNRIEASVGPGLTGLMGDAHRIRQVLLNLVGNAAKFTQDGRILISAAVISGEEASVEVELTVTDSGIGIPEHDRARIFEAFITLDSAFDRSNTGSGLGLAICRRIVAGMGGSIGIADGFDGGSRFWVRLRLDRAKLSAPTPEPAIESSVFTESQRVLIVEDNDINRMVVREMLLAAGHQVTEARNGQEGIDAAETKPFDIIFMDISMPGIDGIETTRRIRSGKGINSTTPIIGLTAHVLPEGRTTVIEAGMLDCLAKPVRRNEMLTLISNYTGPVTNAGRGLDNAPEPELPLIDEDTFGDLAAGLPPDLFHSTLVKAAQQINALSEQLAGLDLCGSNPDLGAEVHKVAGAAALIGAKRLHGYLSALEQNLKLENFDAAKEILNNITPIIDDTTKIIIEYIEGN